MFPIHFAPLQGFTEAPYRLIHQAVCGGVASYYTPFIRLEHGQIRKKDLRESLPENNPKAVVVPQIIAGNTDEFLTLADNLYERGHRRIDFNMGCPFPPQARAGRGSGLLPHADRVAAIMTEIARLHQERQIDFSVKMRLGQEATEEAFALLPLLNATPLTHVTLHPRVGKQQYAGELEMEAFRKFYEQCQAPLIFNGMLTSVDDILRIEEQFPHLAGVMIGRGLLSRPTLAQEYASGKRLSDGEVRQYFLEMHRRLLAHYEQAIEGGESQLIQKMHTFWEYAEPLFEHKAVKKILKSGNLRNYRAAVAAVQTGG